jgi:flagellar assembly factor FliW
MLIDTLRFGEVEISEEKIILFNEGLPGLEESRRFALLRFEESNPISWLQDVENSAVCLPVLDSFMAFPSYAFDLNDGDVKELDLQSAEDLHIISVLVIPDDIERMTVNLAAPVVINIRANTAKQIILSGGEYNVRFPVFAEVCRIIREGEQNAGTVSESK